MTSEMIAVWLPAWLPILVSPIVWLLRRVTWLSSTLAALTMSGVTWWLYSRPPHADLSLMGRSLNLSGLETWLLILLALWLVIAFLLAWRMPQGSSFAPFVLMTFGLIAAALMFQEMVLQILILLCAWMVVILLVQGGAQANTRAGTRLLVLAVLALPGFLIGGALMVQRIYYPDDALQTTLIILSLGMSLALMLAVIPFHAWLPQAAEDAPPLVAAWLVAGMGGSYLLVLIELLARNPWLAQEPQVQRLLFIGGLVLGIGGGALTITERHLGRLWAYAVLADLGYVLLGLSLNRPIGTEAALLIAGNRFIALLLAGGALATMRHRAPSLHFEQLVGIARALPVSVFAFAYGSLSLLGLPLTGGFPGHWSVLSQFWAITPGWTTLLVLAALIGALGFLRALAILVSQPDEEAPPTPATTEPRMVALILGGLTVLSLVVALAPQGFRTVITLVLQSFEA